MPPVAPRLAAALLLALGVAAPAAACGASSRCPVEGGYYLARPPTGWDGRTPLKAVVFFHGWQGSAENGIADPDMKGKLDAAGILLVAPNGEGRTWSYPGSPGRHRDEFAFVAAVLDDVAKRFPVDRGRLVASGFSQGGSMVWNLACRMPGRFAAFAPIAGAFWRPHPEACAPGPVRIRHVHGSADATVPMQGRMLRGGMYQQGDVREGWRLFLDANACAAETPPPRAENALACEIWSGCGRRAALSLCLHSGGHDMDARWIVEAFRWLETVDPPAR